MNQSMKHSAMKSKWRTRLCLLAVLALTGCRPSVAPIKIGLAAPLSENQAESGGDLRDGALLAVEELNRAGGLLGRPVELVELDDRADPKDANNVAQRLAADPTVVAVVGHLNSGCSIPASKIYHDHGMAMITPVSTSDKLTEQGYENVFRICIRNSDQGPAAAHFAIEGRGKRRFFLIDDKTAYGAGITGEFDKAARELGGEIIGRDSISERETDFRPLLTRLRGKDLDFIYFGGMYPEGALLLKQAKELGVTAPILSGDGMFSPELIRLAGDAAEGTIVTHIAPIEPENERQKGFFSAFQSRYGHNVKVYAPLGYDCVMVIAEAVRLEKVADRDAVVRAMRAPDFQYDGVLGVTRFDAQGNSLRRIPYFYEVRRGEFVLCRAKK